MGGERGGAPKKIQFRIQEEGGPGDSEFGEGIVVQKREKLSSEFRGGPGVLVIIQN